MRKTIFRTKLNKNYTVLPNSLLRDKSLSYKARGMLAMILSNSEEWEVYSDWLKDNGTEGRESIRSAMRELEASGYAKFEPLIQNGKLKGTVWTFFDAPIPLSERTSRAKPRKTGFPTVGKGERSGTPTVGESAPKKYNKSVQKENIQKEKKQNFHPYRDLGEDDIQF